MRILQIGSFDEEKNRLTNSFKSFIINNDSFLNKKIPLITFFMITQFSIAKE
jgi:hypothetical protein